MKRNLLLGDSLVCSIGGQTLSHMLHDEVLQNDILITWAPLFPVLPPVFPRGFSAACRVAAGLAAARSPGACPGAAAPC